jgi:hypothetical protein
MVNMKIQHIQFYINFNLFLIDTADHAGKFKKYGSDHKEHENHDSKHKKGGYYEDGKHEHHHVKKGGADEGKYDKEDEGYKKKSGHAEKHSDHHKYSKAGEKEHGSSHHVAHHLADPHEHEHHQDAQPTIVHQVVPMQIIVPDAQFAQDTATSNVSVSESRE